MRIIQLQILCITSLVLFSCSYSPEGIYVAPVKQVLPKSTISLNNYDGNDTIFLFQPANFTFSITVENVSIKEVDVLLDNSVLLNTTSTSGTFSVDGANLKTGTYQMKIQFTSNSGTGSLADKSGVETVTEWRSWILIIDVDPPSKPILSKSIENGFLKISWTPFTKGSFQNYVFQKVNYFENRIIKINDSKTSYFIDSSYVGNNGSSPSNYYVTINASTGTATSDAKTVDDPQVLSVVYNAKDSTAQLTWRKIKYESAFKDVEISENSVVRSMISATDTTLILKMKYILFGQVSSVGITVNAKYPPPVNYHPFNQSVTIDNPTGALQLSPYQSFTYNKVLNQVMGLDGINSRINFYDVAMQVVGSLSQNVSGPLSIPFPGNYMYLSQGGVYQLNLVSKSSVTVITKGRWGGTYSPIRVSGSDNQLISYGVLDNSAFPDNEYTTTVTDINQSTVYDYTDNYVPYIPNYQYNYSIPILSDDGRYAQKGTSIFQITNGSLTLLGALPASAFSFRPDNTDEMIHSGVPTDILKTTDQTLLRTISPPASGYTQKNYDPATKNILYEAAYADKVYLVNIDTQQTTTIHAWSNGWVFINGWLINSTGYAKRIN